jgi:hypothetical protein
MLNRIDAVMERHLERSYKKMSPGYRRYYHFLQGKWGFLLQTFFALAMTGFEAEERLHLHEYGYAAVYLFVAFILCYFVILHFAMGRKIDKLESRLKFFEAVIVIYFGILKLYEIQAHQGMHAKFFLLLTATMGIGALYLMRSHFHRLKDMGRVTWLEH